MTNTFVSMTCLSLGTVFVGLAAGFGLLVMAGCATAPQAAPAPNLNVDLKAEETQLRDAETAWAKDWAAKDLEKIVSHYADDATVMSPGSPVMKGKDAIRNGLKSLLEDPKATLEFATQRVEIAKSGDLAVTQGTYTMTTSDPKTKKASTDKGNYVTAYRRQPDGSWKAVEDINTSDGTE